MVRLHSSFVAIVCLGAASACSSSSTPSAGSSGGGSGVDSGSADAFVADGSNIGSQGGIDASARPMDASTDAPHGSTTIAAARAANVTTPITVVAVVTGLHGSPNDYSQWYIEDPAGGPSSGVAVYCDPDLSSCPTLRAPALHDLIEITGSLTTYKGLLQFIPTAQTVLQSNAPPPPVATVTASDLAEAGDSPYRGVVVHFATKLTVDSVTPSALYDTDCATKSDAGAADAGPPLCTGCEPPTYSGFQANDGSGHEIYIENVFFYTDHLQGSPECLTQAGVIPVMVGKTFSSIDGILDFDPYASAQYIAPIADADYVTP
jgi:hypothetical protein